jgi:quinol monooxygenase YgiN
MFYRITTYSHPEHRQDEIVAWVQGKTEEVRAIDGLVAVDVFQALPNEGVIVASYDDEAAFVAASGTVKAILGELAQFLSGPPVTLSGTAFWTTRA